MEWVSNLNPIPKVPSRGSLIASYSSFSTFLGTIKYVLEMSLDIPKIVFPKK